MDRLAPFGHEQARAEALVLRAMARPPDYRDGPQLADRIDRIVPDGDGLRIETVDDELAALLSWRKLGYLADGRITNVPVRAIDGGVIVGGTRASVTVVNTKSDPTRPITAETVLGFYDWAEACHANTPLIFPPPHGPGLDDHGCEPDRVGWLIDTRHRRDCPTIRGDIASEGVKDARCCGREPANELAMVLRVLLAITAGRAKFDTWGRTVELIPRNPGDWNGWDAVAAMILLGASTSAFGPGDRTVDFGQVRLSSLTSDGELTAAQHAAARRVPTQPGSWLDHGGMMALERLVHDERIQPSGVRRPSAWSVLPALQQRGCSAWLAGAMQ